MSKIIGIDLGTTNSVVAVMEGGEPTVITTQEAAALLRSVVGFTKMGKRHRWSAGKTSGCFQPGTDHQLHQTSHGHEVYRDH